MSLPLLHSEPGPLLVYLSKLQTAQSGDLQQIARDTIKAVRSMLTTPEGQIFLDLLEKSTQLSSLPILADERALCARNAQTFILSDLRRIASNETELLARADAPSRRTGRGNPGARRTGG